MGRGTQAYVVAKEGCNPTAEDIINFCKENMARFKAPKMVEFCQLPENGHRQDPRVQAPGEGVDGTGSQGQLSSCVIAPKTSGSAAQCQVLVPACRFGPECRRRKHNVLPALSDKAEEKLSERNSSCLRGIAYSCSFQTSAPRIVSFSTICSYRCAQDGISLISRFFQRPEDRASSREELAAGVKSPSQDRIILHSFP